MKFEIQDETQATFGSLRVGTVFLQDSGCFIKHDGTHAVAIYKTSGMLNAGQAQFFGSDVTVQVVTKLVASVN